MNNLENFRQIKAFVFDLDGVLSNQHLFIFENGKIIRQLHEKDLFALRLAVQQGYEVAIITGASLDGLIETFKAIGITNLYEKSADKKSDYDDFIYTYDLDHEQVLYMGDDLPDYQVMRIVGMPVCPKNAAAEIKEIALYISPFSGGEGCVRDVIEKVLRLKKHWVLPVKE